MADEETFARVKERWNSLTDEQRNEIRKLVKKQVPIPGVGAGMVQAYQRSLGHPATQALAAVTGVGLLGASAAAPVIAGASAGGLGGAAGQLGRLLARMGVGAGAGAAVGSLPVVGMGAKEGAQLGAMLAIGQKGTGALWRHGKRKKLIEWLIEKTTGDPAKGAAAGRKVAQVATKASAPSASMPRGTSGVVHMEPTKTLAQAEARHVSASWSPSASDQFLAFVRREGPKFKRGERVWFVRDGNGNPVETFTSGAQATGWIKRAANRGKGYTTDFFENLWAEAPAKASAPARTVSRVSAPARASAPARTVSGAPSPTKAQVDARLREAQDDLRFRIRQIEERGNLKTYAQGQRSARRGYEQRDIVEDYINGIELDPNAEYVLNQSAFQRLGKVLREKVTEDLVQEMSVPF